MSRIFDVKFADNVSQEVREVCSRYGEQVVGSMFASQYFAPVLSEVAPDFDDELYFLYTLAPTRIQMREWLAEQISIREYRERWIPLRNLVLEIALVLLILGQIILTYWREAQQSKNFAAQQQVLTNLETSSRATADALTALRQTTGRELDETRDSAALAERSAKASEESAATAARTLRLSERPYLSAEIQLVEATKAREKLKYAVTIINSGKTTAIDVVARIEFVGVPKGTTEGAAHDQALQAQQPFESRNFLAAGQTLSQEGESPMPLTEDMISKMNDGNLVMYSFLFITYKDSFSREHHTQICTFYNPMDQRMSNCSTLNTAD